MASTRNHGRDSRSECSELEPKWLEPKWLRNVVVVVRSADLSEFCFR